MNAFTSDDMTCYFINVPKNKLELWMWMESERLYRPVFREFYAERDVVFEERRMRTESTPLGKFSETFNSMFWESHPYSWPTVGWPSTSPPSPRRKPTSSTRVLRAAEHHADAGRRLQARGSRPAGREIFRPHPARQKGSPRRRHAGSEAVPPRSA
jgi:hypothetical protein